VHVPAKISSKLYLGSEETQRFLAGLNSEILCKPHTHAFWVENLLGRIVEFFELDQISVWRLSGNYQRMMCHYFHTLYNGNYANDFLIKRSDLPLIFDHIMAGTPIILTADSDNSAESPVMRYYLCPMGVHSSICVPLAVNGRIEGMMCLETIEYAEWQPAHLLLAQLLAGIFSQLFARQDHQKITDRMIKTEKLEVLGRLSGGIAHDFNNVLTVLISASEMAMEIIDSTRPNHRLTRYLGEIHEAALRGERLTRQLLSFSRQHQIQKTVMNINKVILDLKNMLDRIMGSSINIILELDYSLDRIIFNQSQVEQVLINLAVNARHAMSEGGELRITTRKIVKADQIYSELGRTEVESFLLLEVVDNGIGIPPENLPYVTDPLYSSRRENGTGFGLAIVNNIVNEHNGTLRIDSNPPDGTRVSIYLPLREFCLPDASDEMMGIDTNNMQSPKILLVEHEIRQRKLIKNHLLSKKYRVTESANAQDAINKIEQNELCIDMVITEVIMPGINGYEFGHYMMSRYPDIKIMYLSDSDAAIDEIVILSKNSTYLQKPFTLEQMVFKIEDMLAT
jgi:signal transduction histidine kinase/CheY-like chemotaxis protein